jgi:predicted GIY-YIG superfamily endonuclease
MPALQFHYVYILQSDIAHSRFYTGLTTDLPSRLHRHNTGANPHTADHRPWSIKTATAFRDPARAAEFERYLKTSSGRAFAKRHL